MSTQDTSTKARDASGEEAMAERRAIVAQIARRIMERGQYQGWKGRKADGLAVEAAAGALAATVAMHGNDHPLSNAVALFATMVGIRGWDYVKENAAKEPAQTA